MKEKFKLYEIPENSKLYFDDNIEGKKDIVVIFDHIDGFYSYCWLEEDKKIEKFTENELKHSMVNEYILGIKINEIIDKINEMEK